MGYPDFPFTNDGKSFTHHTQVLEYLKNYAKEHRLRDNIKVILNFAARGKSKNPAFFFLTGGGGNTFYFLLL